MYDPEGISKTSGNSLIMALYQLQCPVHPLLTRSVRIIFAYSNNFWPARYLARSIRSIKSIIITYIHNPMRRLGRRGKTEDSILLLLILCLVEKMQILTMPPPLPLASSPTLLKENWYGPPKAGNWIDDGYRKIVKCKKVFSKKKRNLTKFRYNQPTRFLIYIFLKSSQTPQTRPSPQHTYVGKRGVVIRVSLVETFSTVSHTILFVYSHFLEQEEKRTLPPPPTPRRLLPLLFWGFF